MGVLDIGSRGVSMSMMVFRLSMANAHAASFLISHHFSVYYNSFIKLYTVSFFLFYSLFLLSIKLYFLHFFPSIIHTQFETISWGFGVLNFDVWDAESKSINQQEIREAFSNENIQDSFEYTMMCFKESLRIEPPEGHSTSHKVIKDVVLAPGTDKELKIRAGDPIHINMTLLHHDARQWGAQHNEFIPERFDSHSSHFLAPNGKPRHPFSYAPFLGGHRVCLGKTFSENVGKRLIPMLFKFYKFEYVDPRMKKETFAFDLFQIKLPVIKYKFEKRLPAAAH